MLPAFATYFIVINVYCDIYDLSSILKIISDILLLLSKYFNASLIAISDPPLIDEPFFEELI